MASHARTNTGTSANPNPVLKGDVAYYQVEGSLLVIVVTAEQQGASGEATVISDCDVAQVVDPHVFADPAVVTDGEFPGT